MSETELKFQVPAARRTALDQAVAGRAPGPRQRLRAAYHDSPTRQLAAAGLALRVRREGRHWVQTLKGGADHGMTRPEHNVPRGAGAALPALDPELHRGTAVGEALHALLAGPTGVLLGERFRTDVLRRTRVLRVLGGRVELAYDVGRIDSGPASVPLNELEIELISGSPRAVLAAARTWVARHGLWLDMRSKAQRGDELARGLVRTPPVLATPLRLKAGLTSDAAWRAVLQPCVDQILGNAAVVASGEHDPEHVHQLRVGLRRLRSALRLFDGLGADPALDAPVAALFQRLGASRDRTVVEGEFGAALQAAMGDLGLTARVAPPPAATSASPCEIVRDTAVQWLLLDLLAALQPAGLRTPAPTPVPPPTPASPGATPPEPGDPPPETVPKRGEWRRELIRRLDRLHRRCVADAKRFAELDDAGRHRLRKRAKRLRYATEFCAGLFDARACRRYLRTLRALQERLGAICDVSMALALYAPRDGTTPEPGTMFALGWLASRHDRLIDAAAPDLRAFARQRPAWNRR